MMPTFMAQMVHVSTAANKQVELNTLTFGLLTGQGNEQVAQSQLGLDELYVPDLAFGSNDRRFANILFLPRHGQRGFSQLTRRIAYDQRL
jgi:hypothetical protein